MIVHKGTCEKSGIHGRTLSHLPAMGRGLSVRKTHYLPAVAVLLGLAGHAMAMQTASSPTDVGATMEYTVQSGDTVSSIAQAFHTTIQTVVALNHLADPNLINTGQQLMVPSPNAGIPPGAQPVVCTLTAYTDGYASTGKVPGQPGYGITSTGQVAMQGLTVAVDPGVIPYGTPLLIPGVGVRVAEDTGGAIVGDHIDVFYNSDQTALNFGVKRGVLVYILPKKDVTFIHRLPVLAQDINRAHAYLRHAAVQDQVYTSSALLKAAATLAAPSGVESAAALLATGTPARQSPKATRPAAARRSPDHPQTVLPLVAKLRTDHPAHGLQPASRPARATAAVRALTPRIDVLDAWNVMLEQDVWQPILRAAGRAIR